MRALPLLVLVAVPATARTYSHDGFLGWSPDGSFYLYTTAGHDMRADVIVLSGGKKVTKYEFGEWPEGAGPQILVAHGRPAERRVDPLASMTAIAVIVLLVLVLMIFLVARPPWIPGT